jgi:hypothetical protein
MPITEDGAASPSQLTLEMLEATKTEVVNTAKYNPVPLTYPPGAEIPTSDLPPDKSVTQDLRFALTSQVFPDEDSNHLQLWLWEVGENRRLIYTDERIYYDAYDDEAKELLTNMIAWIFSQIPKETPAAAAATEPAAETEDAALKEEPAEKEEPRVIMAEAPVWEDIAGPWAFYVDAAGQYWRIARNSGLFSYNMTVNLPGFRIGGGLVSHLGPGDLGLGLEAGYNKAVAHIGAGEDRPITLTSLVCKADYTLPLDFFGLGIRFGVLGGYVLNINPDKNFGDIICGGRLYAQWTFVENLSLYAGGGADLLLEKQKNLLLPLAELGLRWALPFTE